MISRDLELVSFLQWALPRMGLRWRGFRKVRGQVGKRLRRRLSALKIADLESYADYLRANHSEWEFVRAACHITISRFYRDRAIMDTIFDQVLPDLAARARSSSRQRVTAWCLGIASGEEPYTLSLGWRYHRSSILPELRFEIVGVDSDSDMIERAKQGVYPASSLKELPVAWIDEAFIRYRGDFELRPQYREGVRFVEVDLANSLPVGTPDLVLCRNSVFTYFDDVGQDQVLEQLSLRMEKSSYLVLGAHETLPQPPRGFETIGPTSIYRLVR